MSANVSIVLFIYAVFLVGIPALIGVYVYRDATGRGMNRVLWTLVAVLAPSFIGLIIYLLVRSSYPDLKCPNCAANVMEQYAVCPKCGAKLKAACPNCGFPSEPDWSVCPKCASPLPESRESVTPPVKKKDTALWKLLLFVIAAPILLLVLLVVFSFSRGNAGRTGVVSTTSVPMDHFSDDAEVEAWLDASGEDYETAYALCCRTERDGQKVTHYLIYCPAVGQNVNAGIALRSGLFGGNTVSVSYETSSSPGSEATLTLVSAYSEEYANLKVTLNGKKLPCVITETDHDPAMFESISEGTYPANKG